MVVSMQTLVLSVALCIATHPELPGVSALATVLGVEPGNEAGYAVASFKCLDGSGAALPASAINDEFCDCDDGSDEPGTGACAGQDKTLFFCPNQGSMPRRIYASRVGDGVCDCCDGSDEASISSRSGFSRCSNVCAEEGVRKHAEREERIATLKRALQRQDEIRKEGVSSREKLTADEATLSTELKELETDLAEKTKAADVEREAQAAAEAEKKKAEEAEKAIIDAKCTWRQTSGCSAAGDREPANDKPCSASVPAGTSGYCDCNNDEIYGAEDTGFGCEVTGGSRVCNEVCFKAAPAATADSETKPAEESPSKEEEEKPQVSEYSKWMDGAADKMGENDASKDEAKEEKQVSEYSKWMEGAGDTDDEETEEEKKEPVSEEKSTAEETAPKEKTAVDLETEAKSLVNSKKDKIQDIQDQLENLKDDKLGYASLNGRQLERRVSEFNYKIDFYSRSLQDSVSLGNWKEWTGPRSAVFDQGTMCWGGPARKLNVNFVCGEKEQILDVFEPSRCVYEATVEHPGACDSAELESLSKGLPVVGPRDEL